MDIDQRHRYLANTARISPIAPSSRPSTSWVRPESSDNSSSSSAMRGHQTSALGFQFGHPLRQLGGLIQILTDGTGGVFDALESCPEACFRQFQPARTGCLIAQLPQDLGALIPAIRKIALSGFWWIAGSGDEKNHRIQCRLRFRNFARMIPKICQFRTCGAGAGNRVNRYAFPACHRPLTGVAPPR